MGLEIAKRINPLEHFKTTLEEISAALVLRKGIVFIPYTQASWNQFAQLPESFQMTCINNMIAYNEILKTPANFLDSTIDEDNEYLQIALDKYGLEFVDEDLPKK